MGHSHRYWPRLNFLAQIKSLQPEPAYTIGKINYNGLTPKAIKNLKFENPKFFGYTSVLLCPEPERLIVKF